MTTVFGPVPSRRLGRSLGIDVIPAKTCSFDCVYCESGPTTHLTVGRRAFVAPDRVIADLEDYFQQYPEGADVLTFSGAGEPTLYEPLGELLRYIKRRFAGPPLVVLTNGSLLWDPKVREDLMLADRVVPSLDAATEDAFLSVNRPHPKLDFRVILEGLEAFRKEYRGSFCLEVMLVAGYNDDPDQLGKLRRLVDRLSPDRIELNSVVRPPADPKIRGLSASAMEAALKYFPKEETQIIGSFESPAGSARGLNLEARILDLVRRRPCTVSEMAASLGVASETLSEAIKRMLQNHLLVGSVFGEHEYICACTNNASGG